MSAIKSVIPGSSQFLEIDPTLAEGVTAVAVSSPSGTYTKAISVRTEDIFFALGATPNTERDAACASIQRERAAWQARAEEAEAERDEARHYAESYQLRAFAAEAKVSRVHTVLDGIGRNSVFVDEVRKALDPAPEFTLPTEAGVAFEAMAEDRTYCQFVTVVGLSHPAYALGESIYWAEDVMNDFTDHRLLGADQ